MKIHNYRIVNGLNRCLRFAIGTLLLTCAVGATESTVALFTRTWIHASETSAVIYWQLGDLSKEGHSYVEYGPTSTYGQKTERTAAAWCAQFHRLRGLSPETTYHYRPVVVMDGQEYRGPDATFTTHTIQGAITVPGDLPGPPYLLNKEGATYVLRGDIVAEGTAVEIQAPNVTFDLDGHTLTFGNKTGKQVYGIHINNKGKAVVCNGHILQGAQSGNYSSGVESRNRPEPADVFGISTDVHLPNAYPVRFFGSTAGVHLHHNLLYSSVRELESRHYPGNDLLRLDAIGAGVEINDNLLSEGCHIGIRLTGAKTPPERGPEVHHNEIRHHQRYVNGYAIMAHCPRTDFHHNRVTSIGRSVHLTEDGILFHDNWLDTRGHKDLDDMPQGSRPWQERRVELHGIKFEGDGAVNCKVNNNFMRITQRLPDAEWDYVPATPLNIACYNSNAMNEVYGNTFVAFTEYAKTHHGGYGEASQWASSIYFIGMQKGPAAPGKYSIYVHDNTFISNDLFVGSGYQQEVNMTVRIEKNIFKLASAPAPTQGHQPFWGIGAALSESIKAGDNVFEGMAP